MADYRFLPPGLSRRLAYSRTLIQQSDPVVLPEPVQQYMDSNKIFITSILKLVNPSNPLEFGECCSICIDKYTSFQIIRILGCKHSFHKRCIDTWFRSNKSCGICRSTG
jgi:hypothetical protein